MGRNGMGCACSAPALQVAPALHGLRGLGNYHRGYTGVGDLDPTTYTYVVAPGDSLSLITWRFGRPAEDVPLLFNVNAVAGVVKNHHELSVGQRLWLPIGWSPAPTRTDLPTRAWQNQAAAALQSFGLSPRPDLLPKPAPGPFVGPTPGPGPAPGPGPTPPPAPPKAGNVGVLLGGAALLIGGYLILSKS